MIFAIGSRKSCTYLWLRGIFPRCVWVRPWQVMASAFFYSGLPKYLSAETINAVIDRFLNYRGQISAAWTTPSKWEEAEPVDRAMIMPPSIFRAAISLSLLWGWYKLAGAMLLGFHGLLRPSEILLLKRSDLGKRCAFWRENLLREDFEVKDEPFYASSACPGQRWTYRGLSWLFVWPLGEYRIQKLYSVAVPLSFAPDGIVFSSIWEYPPLNVQGVWPLKHFVGVAPLGCSTAQKMWTEFFWRSLAVEENFGALPSRCFGASFACRFDPGEKRFVFGTSRLGIVFASFGCRPS